MKKSDYCLILIFIILIVFTCNASCQPDCQNSFKTGLVYAGLRHYDHSIGVTFQGVDAPYLLAGVTYQQSIKHIGGYISASKGRYWVYGTRYEIPHYKFAAGVKYKSDITGMVKIYFVAGASVHEFWGNKREDVFNGRVNEKEQYYRLHHISCEQGIGAEIGRINTGFRIDFIRGEHNVDLLINF